MILYICDIKKVLFLSYYYHFLKLQRNKKYCNLINYMVLCIQMKKPSYNKKDTFDMRKSNAIPSVQASEITKL